MWLYIILISIIGLIGGFGSISEGRLFQKLSGHIILSVIFFAEIGLSVAFALKAGIWKGVGLFLLGWFVMGHIGGYLFRIVYNRNK